MKHTWTYIASLAVCLLITGCGQDAAPLAEAAAKADATGESLQLGAVEIRTQEGGPATRATAGYTALTTKNAQMGLFRKENGAVYTALQNVPYKYMKPAGGTTPEWLPSGGDDQTVWLHPTTQANIAACYPYNASLSLAAGTGVVNLAAAIRNAAAPQDLWYNHFTASGANCKITSLLLNQAYARLQITILIDGSVSYVENPYLYKLAISGGRVDGTSTTDGIFSAATLDMYTGTYTRSTKDYTPVNTTANTYRITDNATTTKAAFDLMAIPAALTGAVSLTVSVGGTTANAKTMTVSIPAADFVGALTAGKIYKVSVKIKGTDIGEFSTVTTEWESMLLSGNGTTVDGQQYYDFSNPTF